jgi:hypothetical protein
MGDENRKESNKERLGIFNIQGRDKNGIKNKYKNILN